MVRRSKKRVASLTIGDTVIVPISEFDRSKASLRSMLGVIVEGDGEAMDYTVKSKFGILDTKYLNGTITKSTAQLNLSDNVSSKIVSVRAAARFESMEIGGSGQGYSKCNCTGECKRNNCSCKKEESFMLDSLPSNWSKL